MSVNHQPAILEAMRQPEFYRHPVAALTRCETHIPTVFLTGQWVYKVKKPVDLGFLDFSTLEKRKACCDQEILLNRRLSSGVYRDVRPITRQGGRYALGGSGQVVEYAVAMRQLNEADAMHWQLAEGRFREAKLEPLVRRLVGFYENAAVSVTSTPVEALAWKENLDQVAAVTVPAQRSSFAFVRSASHSFFSRHSGLFEKRRLAGRIRDCHGDLRCDHIYFTDDGIQIIDCIEFSSQLRILDVICDLAFLVMDLAAHGFADLSRTLVRRYVELTDDLGALPLLDFYCCYRAMVRFKVSCLRLKEQGVPAAERKALQLAAADYLSMATGYAATFSRPTLWLVCGLPATGKSTVAAALAELWDIPVIRSDVVRKTIFADDRTAPGTAPFEKGIYSAQATEMTYREVLALAEELLKKGLSVIVDATFSRRMQRNCALRLAEAIQVTAVFVECRATESIIADRLRKRESEPSVSDARLIHLDAFLSRFEPFQPMANAKHIVVDTAVSPALSLRQIVLADALWDHPTRQGGPHV
ncbi:AAA family ATPase [Desulfosarcina ovata]|uniref:Aminoglycoside phosphotransferase domain-containing protein n=1 Tax=Desulfosarcina ovata subsp. ovata TaxID=2752305 RepID=A0A5K8AK84_9BACT|nr:AAA family ATPase [Desulfosarcina ovata]BBO92998.1 hypothetical protein DSCOOX_61780 [Desulfosarcina ovata subsp. ovata]